MKNLNKIFSIITALCLSLVLFAGCQSTTTPSEETSEPTLRVRIAGLKGPTTMGMVQLMNSVDEGTALHNYEFTMYGTADEIVPRLIQGEIDIAAVPANLASVLYNRTEGGVQMLAINTLGVLYIVETGDSITNIEDLRGQTIYMAGKGTVPEFVLTYVLEQNGMVIGEDVFVEFKAEATEVAAILASTENAIALLPQPYATTVQMQNENVRVALDMTEQWNAVADGNTLITGVLIVRTEFAEQNPEIVADFLAEYEASINYVNANTDVGAMLAAQYEIAPEAVALKALPLCNITYIGGEEMKPIMNAYLQVLFDLNPESVGGTLPDEEIFYYTV